MEFCAEVAVFQSACALAESSYPGGLKEFNRNSHDADSVRKIVCYSVAEITRGLCDDLTRSQADHWNLMLTVMSTWKTISCVPKLNAVLSADDLLSDFIQPLPDWNFPFFYDLIKHNNWIQQFLQVIDATKKTAGVLLVQLILDELHGKTLDAGDIQIVIGILEYFVVIENKYLSCLASQNDTKDSGVEIGENTQRNVTAVSSGTRLIQSSNAGMSGAMQNVSVAIQNGQRNLRILMCDEGFLKTEASAEEADDVDEHAIIKVMLKYLEMAFSIDFSRFMSVADSSRLLIAVLNLANFIAGGSVMVFRNHCLFESYSLCPRYGETDPVKTASRSLTDDEFDRLIALNIVERPLLYIKSTGCSDSLFDECIDGMNQIIVAFTDNLSQIWDYLCPTTELIDVMKGALVIPPVLRLDCYRRIFLNAYDCLVACIDESHVEGLLLLSDLCVSRVLEFVQSLEANKEGDLMDFERALVLIERNFVGGKERFEWLIQTDCIEIMKDPRWLKCLEDNWETFLALKANSLHNLLLELKRLKLHLAEESLKRLQQLILKVYCRLSLDEQIDVLMMLYERSEPSPFNVDSDDFARQLLNAQSKLMTCDVQLIEDSDVVNDFSFLVFQRPLETLDRLILVAVKNKQHVDVVAKVFLELPTLTELENKTGDLVVFETISHWLWMAETFKDEEQNAIALCRHLLKSNLNDCSLRLTEQFMKHCILSHVSHLVMKLDSPANLLYAHLTLELILVHCESLVTRRREWPSAFSVPKLESLIEIHCVVPLISWLCQVIDSCRILFLDCAQYCLQKTGLKEKAITALNGLLEIVVVDSCEDEMPGETEEPRGKTACVLSRVQVQWLLHQLSHLHWTVPLYVLHLLSNDDSSRRPLSYPQPLASVLQTPVDKSTAFELPGFVALFEFCRISDHTLDVALKHLTVPDTANDCHNFYSKVTVSLARVLLNSILPEWLRIGRMVNRLLCDYFVQRKVDMFSELAVCKVFVDAVLLIKHSVPEYSDEKFLSVWQHLTNAFADYLKIALQSVDRFRFAKVGIGLVIRFVCIVPAAVTQPLDILVADIISGLRTDTMTIAEIRSAFAEVECLVDMATSKAILDQIVM